MRTEQHIGLSFGQVRTWHDGLGEFSLQLGRGIAGQAAAWRAERGVQFHFHLPARWHGHFGPAVNYLATGDLQRWLHWRGQRFDLWHSLHQHNPFKAPLTASVRLQTVHDANFLYLKAGRKRERYGRWMKVALRRCDEVITISRYVQDDLRDKVGHAGPTRVIYNGVRDLSHDPQEALPGLQGQAFLLHISRLAPSKNVELLLQLAALWPQRQFVLAGGDSPYARTVQDSLISRQLHNVRLFLDVSDAQKAWLYAHCNAFLFPSMAEGFGLPPIEAMHFGKPVFLSRLTSLPEIGGAVATYWDDLAPAAMRAVLETSDLTPVPARQALIAAHARQFNWPSCVGAYLSCYRQWLKLPESAV